MTGRLKSLVKPKRTVIYLSAFLSWIQFLTRISSFALIAKVVAVIYEGGDVQLVRVVLYFFGLTFFGFLVSVSAKRLQGIPSQYARDRLKEDFFRAFARQEAGLGKDATEADILTVASQGIDSLDTYYSYYLPLNLRTYFNCGTVLLIVCGLFPLGGLIFVLSLPLIPVSILLMQKRSQKIMNRYWSSYMDVGNLFLDDLNGLNTLYSYQADDKYEQDFAAQAEDFRDATMELLSFQLQSVGYMDAVMYLGIGVAGFVATLFLASGQLSLFTAVYFVLIATEFFTPIREAGYGMHLVMMTTKMADRIFGFLDTVQERKDSDGDAIEPFEVVRLDAVGLSYQEHSLFENVSFSVHKGELVVFAGESGRGKTSLAHVLLGRLEPSCGTIYLGERELSRLSKQAIRKEVNYVSSESVLLRSTILENLQLATDKSEEELQTWLRENQLLSFVWELPDGLQTMVGENGAYLSPGQRQQVICVRAILAEASFYVFDEITSSVDRDNENILYDLISLVSQKALVIEITHKMQRVMMADKVLFFGETGPIYARPQDLYQEVAEYRQLYDTQAKLEEMVHGR